MFEGTGSLVGKKEFTKELSPDGEDRLRVRINVDKGKVKDVVVQYESKIKEKWYCIVRYDCSHGFFHRDMLNPKREEIKQSIAMEPHGLSLWYLHEIPAYAHGR